MKYIADLFEQTKELLRLNMMLIQPLVLFFILILLILMVISDKVNFKETPEMSIQILVVAGLCAGLITVVFNAGWYNMFNKCVKTPINANLTKAEQAMKSLELFKEFFPGVALYFLPFFLGSLIYLALLAIIFLLAYNTGQSHIGIPEGVSWGKFVDAEESYKSVQDYLLSLPVDVKEKINLWSSLVMGAFIANYILNYLTMFWAQFVVIKNVNPVAALVESIKTVVKHPLRAFIISLSFAFALQVCFIIFSINFILFQFLGIIIYVFVITYFNLMIFLYLDKQQGHSAGGADCFR